MGNGGDDGSCGRGAPNSSEEDIQEEGVEEEEGMEGGGAAAQADSAAMHEYVPDSSHSSSSKQESEDESGIGSIEGISTRVAGGSNAEARREDEGAGTIQLPAGASMQGSEPTAIFDCATASRSIQGSGPTLVFDCATVSRSIPGAAGSQGRLAEAHVGRSHMPANADLEPEQQESPEPACSPATAPAGALHGLPGSMPAGPQQLLQAHYWPSRLDMPKTSPGRCASGMPAAAAAPSSGLLAAGGVCTSLALAIGDPAASLGGAAPAPQPSGHIGEAVHHAARPARQATAVGKSKSYRFSGQLSLILTLCYGTKPLVCPHRKLGRPSRAHTAKSQLKDAFLSIYSRLRKALPDAVFTPFLVSPTRSQPNHPSIQKSRASVLASPSSHIPDVHVQEQVNQLYVADYNDWVKIEDEIWLKRIRKNISVGQYSTRTAFLADVQQLLTNATGYNNPGHGLHGDQGATPLAGVPPFAACVATDVADSCACVRHSVQLSVKQKPWLCYAQASLSWQSRLWRGSRKSLRRAGKSWPPWSRLLPWSP